MLGFAPISTRPISALPAPTGPATQYGSTDPSSTTTRTNLVTNPSMEVDLTGWGSAQPFERIQGVHRWANHAMVSYCTNADTNISYTTATATQTGQHIISVYFWAQAALAGKTMSIAVEGGTAGVTAGASTPATLVGGGWARASLVITVNTTGTVLFVNRLNQAPNLTPSEPIVTDGALMETGAVLLPYFDGSQIDGISPDSISWSGTPWASTSTVTYRNSGMVHYNTYTAAAAIPRSATTAITASPAPVAAGTTTKPQTATGTTVAPTTAASGTVTRFGTATAVTVTPATAAALGAKTSTATALCDITPFTGTDLWTNTGVETDLTGWEGYNTWSTIARTTSDAHSGAASALNTTTLFNRYGTKWLTNTVMTAGRSYRADAWFKWTSGSDISYRWYSFGEGNGPDLGPNGGVWEHAQHVIENASTTAANNDFMLTHWSSANVGSTFLTDDFHLYDITRTIETQASATVVRAASADFVHTITTESANLVSNGTFETDTSGWSYSPSFLYLRTDGGHTGSRSANMSPPAAGAPARARTYVTVSSLASQLRVKVWAKLEAAGGNDRMTIWLVNPNEVDVVVSPSFSEVRLTRDQWALYEWVFTDISAVNITTFFLQVVYLNDVTGSVRFDDVSATEIIPGSIAPSATPVITNFGSATAVTVGPESSTERVTNGTFESASVTPWYGVFDPAYGSVSAGFLTTTNQAHTGTYAGYMYPTGLPLPKIGQDITFADHKPYVRISFWAWQFSGSLTALSACISDAALTNPQWATAQNVNALNTWQHYSFDIDVSVTSLTGPNLTAMIRSGSNGAWFYFDDISISEVIPAAEVVAASGIREVAATADVVITPTTAADGIKVGGAVTGDDAVTITPTTAAAGQTDHLSTATDPAITPIVAASSVTTHLATATAVTVTPTTSVVPLPITDQATADVVVTPVVAATPSALTKTQAATGNTVSPIATSVPSAVLKSTGAATTDTPVPAATAAAITKTSSAATQVGGSGSLTKRDPALTLPRDYSLTPFDDQFADAIFDTTSIPSTATIDSWQTVAVFSRLSGTDNSASGNIEYIPDGQVSAYTTLADPDTSTHTITWSYRPAVWWSSVLSYRFHFSTSVNGDLSARLTDFRLEVTYTMAGITTTATLGPKTSSGDASVTITPATTATGVSTGSGTGTAFLTISPATTAAAAAISRSQAATDTPVAPVVAATGTALKAIDAPAVTISPASAASATVTKPVTATGTTVSPTTAAVPLPITDTATASITVSPVTAATAAPIVDTATADTVVSLTTAATPAAMIKTASASATAVTPITQAIAGTSANDSVTISPTTAAAGYVTRSASASVTVTPTPSTVVPLREAMAALAFTVSLTTSSVGARTAVAQASALITALSDAQAIYNAMGQASTTVSPIPFAKVGADWTATASLVIAAVSQADARTRRPERWGTLRI